MDSNSCLCFFLGFWVVLLTWAGFSPFQQGLRVGPLSANWSAGGWQFQRGLSWDDLPPLHVYLRHLSRGIGHVFSKRSENVPMLCKSLLCPPMKADHMAECTARVGTQSDPAVTRDPPSTAPGPVSCRAWLY